MNFLKSIWNWFHQVVWDNLVKLEGWILRYSCLGRVDGVAICDVASRAKEKEQAFLIATQEAMALIKQHDSRRYHRVCRQLDMIVNSLITTTGEYSSRHRACHVDYAKYLTTPDSEWNLRYYACLLVHEATHGLICDRKIRYDKNHRERIEKLCVTEERRFARRVDPEWAEAHLVPFDAGLWTSYWDVPVRKELQRTWERFRENERKSKR